jgi:3-hydroxyisobutyrate dehydrogenase-like beta-hydroxyacid dehydrogenase
MSKPELPAIGAVGLGKMGRRIASHLVSRGYEVYGTDRTGSRADALIGEGLHWCDSPGEVAETAEVVFNTVGDLDELEEATEGPDGILTGLSAGKVYADTSIVSPEASRELAARVEALGASMLAAPLSASVPAADGELPAIIVGGDPKAFERVEPILHELGGTVTFVGEIGQALLLNLAVNVTLAIQVLALSEGVQLAEHGGIDRRLALDVLRRSAIGSPLLQKGALLELPDKAWFDVYELLSAARVLGYEHRDIADLFQAFAEMVTAA